MANAPKPTDRLFLALFPDAVARPQLDALARQLITTHGLAARPMAADRLHVTLAFLGDSPGLQPALVERAVRASEKAARAGPAFRVSFDLAISFKGRAGHQPLVLTGGEGLDTLRQFRQALNRALAAEDVAELDPHYTPHVTLAYGDSAIEDQAVAPVGWQVKEFVLVHSAIGRGRYHVLGRWRFDY